MAISRPKSKMIGTGVVDDTEYSYANSLTSNLQTQLSSDFASFDKTATKKDILNLGLTQAINNDRVAYNFDNAFVDGFADDTGITTKTTVVRNTTGKYVSTTPSSGVGRTHIVTGIDNTHHDSGQSKFGRSTAIYTDGTNDAIEVSDSDVFGFTSDYTVEFWVYFNGAPANNAHICGQGGNSASNFAFMCRSEGSGNFIFGSSNGSTQRLINPSASIASQWAHVALVKYGTALKLYINGTQGGSTTTHSDVVQNVAAKWEFGGGNNSTSHIAAWWDEIRISSVARYTGNFTPHTSPHVTDDDTVLLIHGGGTNGSQTFTDDSGKSSGDATGTLISDPQTASASTTSVNGNIVYQDAEGTNTLGTDLKIYMSANNGTNWTEASSYTATTNFKSTPNTKIVKLGNTTVTAGTQAKLKAVWANQLDGAGTTRPGKQVNLKGTQPVHSTAQAKFGATSLDFTTAGEKIESPPHPDFDWDGDFTVECWFWRDPNDSGTSRIFNSASTSTAGHEYINVDFENGSTLRCYASSSGSNRSVFSQTTTSHGISNSTWHHCAMVRNGNEFNVYIDGNSKVNQTSSGTIATGGGICFGAYMSRIETAASLQGYFDEMRVSKIARYTGNFTPSTTVFTDDADTVLLIHSDSTQGNTTVSDDASSGRPKTITATGNVKHSTTQSKVPTSSSSMYFDGAGDYLTVGSGPHSDFAFSGDFTVEAWIYIAGTNVSNASNPMGIVSNSTDAGTYSSLGWHMSIQGAGTLVWEASQGSSNSGYINPSGAFSHNTWIHVAAVRIGTTTYLYKDGVQIGSQTTNSSTLNNPQALRIGQRDTSSPTAENFNGYIDEVRISHVARYTANFTPSTSAFTPDSSTILLLHSNTTNNSTTFTDDAKGTGKSARLHGWGINY